MAFIRAASSRGLKGFGKIIVGAYLEADNSIYVIAARSKHQHRHFRLSPDFAQYLEPVQTGKHDVENDEVGFSLVASSAPMSPRCALLI